MPRYRNKREGPKIPVNLSKKAKHKFPVHYVNIEGFGPVCVLAHKLIPRPYVPTDSPSAAAKILSKLRRRGRDHTFPGYPIVSDHYDKKKHYIFGLPTNFDISMVKTVLSRGKSSKGDVLCEMDGSPSPKRTNYSAHCTEYIVCGPREDVPEF